MEGTAKLIAEEIQNKQYFIEARKWYNDVFLQPTRDVALMLISSTVLALILIFSIYNIYNIFPLSRKVDVVLFLNNTVDFYPTLKKISEEHKPTEQVVAEYLCSQYVKARESYDSRRYPSHYRFITQSSSKDVMEGYYSFLKASPDSPLLLHKNGGKAEIFITSQSLDMQNHLTKVTFNKKIYNDFGELVLDSKGEVDVEFSISTYDFTRSTNAKLDFIVTHYGIKEITS